MPMETTGDAMLDLVGTPYLEGGADPSGFDCFGLARWVVKRETGVELPAITVGWRRHVEPVDGRDQIRRGDLLFFCRKDPEIVDHLGIAINHKDFIHANSVSGQVVCEPIDRHAGRLKMVGRVKAVP